MKKLIILLLLLGGMGSGYAEEGVLCTVFFSSFTRPKLVEAKDLIIDKVKNYGQPAARFNMLIPVSTDTCIGGFLFLNKKHEIPAFSDIRYPYGLMSVSSKILTITKVTNAIAAGKIKLECYFYYDRVSGYVDNPVKHNVYNDFYEKYKLNISTQ